MRTSRPILMSLGLSLACGPLYPLSFVPSVKRKKHPDETRILDTATHNLHRHSEFQTHAGPARRLSDVNASAALGRRNDAAPSRSGRARASEMDAHRRIVLSHERNRISAIATALDSLIIPPSKIKMRQVLDRDHGGLGAISRCKRFRDSFYVTRAELVLQYYLANPVHPRADRPDTFLFRPSLAPAPQFRIGSRYTKFIARIRPFSVDAAFVRLFRRGAGLLRSLFPRKSLEVLRRYLELPFADVVMSIPTVVISLQLASSLRGGLKVQGSWSCWSEMKRLRQASAVNDTRGPGSLLKYNLEVRRRKSTSLSQSPKSREERTPHRSGYVRNVMFEYKFISRRRYSHAADENYCENVTWWPPASWRLYSDLMLSKHFKMISPYESCKRSAQYSQSMIFSGMIDEAEEISLRARRARLAGEVHRSGTGFGSSPNGSCPTAFCVPRT
ncbi:hypothetical protein EVAR_22533_1 [Eumeta japonica]|uniref:Uncharacterized protein n=1 Tax=Eumeta variegata TaxID=151549 RepID=A0A4C1U812_EUMVA|nr:hypothetical protein EVAR_22533_1 [Eumeta japonica]